jgi:hypothetical protein
VSQQPGAGLNVPGVTGTSGAAGGTGTAGATGSAGQAGSGVQSGQIAGTTPVMVLQPGRSVNLPAGTVIAISENGDVLITLPTTGAGVGVGAGGLAGLSSITITPTDSGFVATGRVASGAFAGLEGGTGNAQLKALLDQIADFLPEEYRRKWGLRAKGSDASGIKVSQL